MLPRIWSRHGQRQICRGTPSALYLVRCVSSSATQCQNRPTNPGPIDWSAQVQSQQVPSPSAFSGSPTPLDTENPTSSQDNPQTVNKMVNNLSMNYSMLTNMIQNAANKQPEKETTDIAEEVGELEISRLRKPLRLGEIYSPHDLSHQAFINYQRGDRNNKVEKVFKKGDIFKRLQQDPMTFYKNFHFLADFVTDMGRIKHSDLTGLSAKHQRKMAKAVRRAVGIGLLPSVHKHPELIQRMQSQRNARFV